MSTAGQQSRSEQRIFEERIRQCYADLTVPSDCNDRQKQTACAEKEPAPVAGPNHGMEASIASFYRATLGSTVFLATCCAFALGGGVSISHASKPASDIYKTIKPTRGINPTTISLDDGGSLSFYEFLEPHGFAGAGFLIKYYIVYEIPHPKLVDRDSYMVAMVHDYASKQTTDHFEASASGGDCDDTDTAFFSNGKQVIAVSLDRQNNNHRDHRAGDGPGAAFMQIYLGKRSGPRDIPYSTYSFELKEARVLQGVEYCTYDDIRTNVKEALRKYEEYAP